MSQDGQVKNKMEEMFEGKVMETARSVAFFQGAFLGFNHGRETKMNEMLKTTPSQRNFLKKRYIQYLLENVDYSNARNEKMKRFNKLKEITGGLN